MTTQGVLVAGIDVPIRYRLRAGADIGASAAVGVCDQAWPASFRCEYGGRFAAAAMTAPLELAENVRILLRASAGVFNRSQSREGTSILGMLGVGGGAEIRIASRLWGVGGVRRYWVDDPEYQRLLGADAAFTATTLGVAFVL